MTDQRAWKYSNGSGTDKEKVIADCQEQFLLADVFWLVLMERDLRQVLWTMKGERKGVIFSPWSRVETGAFILLFKKARYIIQCQWGVPYCKRRANSSALNFQIAFYLIRNREFIARSKTWVEEYNCGLYSLICFSVHKTLPCYHLYFSTVYKGR